MKYIKECFECGKERVEKLILYRCPDCGAEYTQGWERWIPVEDKLPKEIGFYYAYPTMEGKAYPVRYIGNGHWVTLFGEKLWKQPTHWLDTPEPPESEGDLLIN